MNIVINLSILTMSAIVAYLLYLAYDIISNKIEAFKIRCELTKEKEDMLLVRRAKKLEENAFSYYYSLAINSPEIIASENAKRIIANLRKEKKINEMYSKMIGARL